MKKITLFLVAMTMSLLSFAAQPKRIYAYDLSSTLVDKVYTFSFTANETPTSGKIIFYDATSSELVGEIALTNPVLGKNEVEIAEYSLPGNDGQQLNWAVELSAAAVTAYEKIFADASHQYRRGFSNVDISPESDYFGTVYVADWCKTKTNSKIYVYNPVYSKSATGYNPGSPSAGWGCSRFTIAPNGNLWLTDYSDGHSGLFLVDPADLTKATQFFAGTRESSGLIKNGNVEVGSSLSCATLYGTGANTKLVTVAEDYTGKSFPVAVFNVGQEDGSLATSWTTAPNILFNTLGNAAQIFDVKACEKGVWVATNRTTGQNTSGATSLRFYTWDGICTWSSHEHTDIINGNLGGGIAITPDEKQIVMKIHDNNIAVFDITWNEDTPTLTTNATFNCGYAAVSAINLDYAGNIVTVAGTNFGNTDDQRMSLVVYSNPTNDNTCEVPAKKADVVTKVEPTVALYTITTNVNDLTMGSVSGNLGTYEDGASAELTAVANEHYEFVNWTGDVNSTENPLNITVDGNKNITANFQEQTKYIITASAADNTMGYVTGGGTYYAGETVTLTAVAKSTYYFVNWSDGNTNATRTFPASANLTLTANFAKANPRAWAYDLKMVEEGDNYKFSFTATTAANATLLFLDKEGNELYAAHDIGAVAAGANTVSIEKAYFTQVKDVYWSVKMDGEAIPAISEITDQSRGIYDFYNMMGVVVDNDPNSDYFGKIYIQQSYEYPGSGSTAARNKTQKAGIFIYDQGLNELNPENEGYKPTMPAGYTAIGKSRESFKRLAINPTNGNLVFGNNIAGEGSVWSVSRDNLTGVAATNIIEGATEINNVNAICYDEDGSLYVLANIVTGSTPYKLYKFTDGVQKELTLGGQKLFIDADVAMTSDGRGGLWIAQRRGAITQYSILSHINVAEDKVDFVLDAEGTYKDWFTGNCFRAAIAYNAAESIVAVQGASKILLFKVSYDALTGAPSISKYLQVSPVGSSVDGLVFDYAGDLYTVNSGSEKFQKFTLPTADNICTVPAPKSQAIVKEIRHTVTTNTIGNGTVIGAGEYVEGETATLIASPAAHHQFVNWTFADATTSTDNPLELVVNSDITVTAHFEPIQYTVVALTNDENKGTMSGAGAYNYGTEVTLTATPKPGYKLLYWSDRTTENPRTITMTKNETISAYFVKEYAVEPTFTIEKVWENTNVPASTNNGFQAVGWDGKIYIKDRLNAAINVYTETGSELYAQLGSVVTGFAGDQPIAVDNAGNIVVRSGSSYFYDSPTQISIIKKGETTGKTIDFALPATGRCDFISASGDIYSAEGGYIYFYCQERTTINRMKIAEGELASIEVVGIGLPAGQTQSHVMTNIFGNIIAHTKSNNIKEINVHTNQTLSLTLPSYKNTTLGGCSFELGGKELIAYNIAGTNYNSEWNIYNMTDKKFLSTETLYAKDKVSTNVVANWLNVQVVDENTAYIYQFCPTVAVAVWKVTMHEVVLRDTENNEDLLTDLTGNTTNVSVYRSLTGGMYNTLCLPFDVDDLTGTPLENATVWQYNGATVKGDGTSKEIFLDFAEVTSIAAGEPYLVEPAEDIAAPMEFKNVTISVTNGNDVAQDAVTMHGILHPTELQANNKSILFLVENNNLAWANETANMNGMRAYFKVNEPSLLSARTRAYIRREPTVATDMENITTSETEIKKVIYNGTLYIIRGDEVYTIQGTKVK